MSENLVAIEPKSFASYETAVREAGGVVSPISTSVKALIWTDYAQPAALAEMLSANPQLEWVQLPFAGVDAFAKLLNHPVTFTSAKGCYSEPVAEHALALCLALGRDIPTRVRATSWGKKFAVSLFDANVVIIGAGGITEQLIGMLEPFRSHITVVRKHSSQPLSGAHQTVSFDALDAVLPKADFVICAAALTPETAGMFDLNRFKLFKPEGYFVNIARGGHVVTDDLISALRQGLIAGAGVDVTDPEPLPDGHALWDEPRAIITPHTADTKPMVERLFSIRIKANVRAFFAGSELAGLVDPELGY